MAIQLNGRAESARLLRRLKTRVRKIRQPITLATILVGNRYDSALYVRLKQKAASQVGIRTRPIQLPTQTTQTKLIATIQKLNRDRRVHGILLQLPLPSHLRTNIVVRAIDPGKDVDGFHPSNRLILPPPMAAVEHFLKLTKPKPKSRVVILGKQSVFTKQLHQRFAARGWKTSIHSSGWTVATKRADIIITALGRGPQLMGTHVKRGAIIIDVGIRNHNGTTIGDVHPSAWPKAKAVSPVPGGVGPLTVYFVLANTYQLATRL